MPDAFVAFLEDAARLAEVDARGQFADDDDVQTGDDLALQAGEIGQRVKALRRAQVRKQVHLLAQTQKAALGFDAKSPSLSYFGPPTAPSSTASTACALAIVASVRGVPCAS